MSHIEKSKSIDRINSEVSARCKNLYEFIVQYHANNIIT